MHAGNQKRSKLTTVVMPLIALVTLSVSGSVAADTPTNSELNARLARLEQTSCKAPELSFRWVGTTELNLVVKASEDVEVDFYVRQHRSLSSRSIASSTISATTGGYVTTENLFGEFRPGQMVEIRGFSNSGNNGSKVVKKASKKELDVEDSGLVPEPAGNVITIKRGPTWFGPFGVNTRQDEEVAREIDLDSKDFSLLDTDGYVVIRWESDSTCELLKHGESNPIVAMRRHLVGIDAGSVFSLEHGGGYKSGGEFVIGGTSRWKHWFSTFGELRISSIGELEEASSDDEPGSDDDSGNGDDANVGEDQQDDIFNPFVNGGGVVSGNLYLQFHPGYSRERVVYPWSFFVGGGFSTRPGDAEELDARVRVFAGLRIQVVRYQELDAGSEFDGASGYLQVGYAHDDLWEYSGEREVNGEMTVVEFDERERLFADMQLTVLGNENARLKLRLYADIPASGDGPADIRLSTLMSLNAKQIFEVFGKKK